MLKTFLVFFSFCFVLCVGQDRIPPQCGENEEIRCVQSCPPERTCRNRGIQFNCLAVVEPCQYKCVCKKGYYRNFLGECITGEQCDQCSGRNEFFACNSQCDNECDTLHKQNRTNCPYVNVVCNPRCYCDDGYARDSQGSCIPAQKCPSAKVCRGPNEVYTNRKRSCPPETCLSLIAMFYCDPKEPFTSGCVCKPGFLRKDYNTPCIPICECPEMSNSPDCHNRRY